MSEPIGPGDWVEVVSCLVDDASFRGRIFRVENIEQDGTRCGFCEGEVGATLEQDGLGELMWCAACELRPIYRKRDADKLIQTLKAPPVNAPNMEPADA